MVNFWISICKRQIHLSETVKDAVLSIIDHYIWNVGIVILKSCCGTRHPNMSLDEFGETHHVYPRICEVNGTWCLMHDRGFDRVYPFSVLIESLVGICPSRLRISHYLHHGFAESQLCSTTPKITHLCGHHYGYQPLSSQCYQFRGCLLPQSDYVFVIVIVCNLQLMKKHTALINYDKTTTTLLVCTPESGMICSRWKLLLFL